MHLGPFVHNNPTRGSQRDVIKGAVDRATSGDSWGQGWSNTDTEVWNSIYHDDDDIILVMMMSLW